MTTMTRTTTTQHRMNQMSAKSHTTTLVAAHAQELHTPSRGPPRPRLNSCDLLISVLECYMMQQIRANERAERSAARASGFVRGSSTPAPLEPSVFHALQAPSITPVEYLRRLARYAFCSRSVFVAAFYLLDRVSQQPRPRRGGALRMNALSAHRLLLTAVVLATKMTDDVLYDNAHFAKVGGVDVAELNMLELDLLKLLNFRVLIRVEDFDAFERRVLDSVLATSDPDYAMLPARLCNLGYGPLADGGRHGNKPEPASPTSLIGGSFCS